MLTQEERALIETHPTRGKEILECMRSVPSEVIQVAYEHHEDVLGQGYPRRLDRNRIHPMTLIVAVADAFCNYTIRNPQMLHPVDALEALRMIRTHKAASLDAQALEALAKVVQAHRVAS